MIAVRRSSEPAVLARNKAAWTSALLGAAAGERKKDAENKYRDKAIKIALVEMFNGKCAYCESKILHADYLHIEHFRPKSVERFRSLTFDWNNLFLACARCNGPEHKGDSFPEQDKGGPPINPCDDLPDDHLAFVYDDKAGIATMTYKTERGRVSIGLFGLNRPDLRAYRSRLIEKISLLSKMAETDPEAKKLFNQALGDGEEYAAFSRELARQKQPR